MFYLGACQKCSGDLVPDEDIFKCLQCGQRYYLSINRETPVHGRYRGALPARERRLATWRAYTKKRRAMRKADEQASHI